METILAQRLAQQQAKAQQLLAFEEQKARARRSHSQVEDEAEQQASFVSRLADQVHRSAWTNPRHTVAPPSSFGP